MVTKVGLEIHVELKTASKLFCSCPVAFGGEPNTRVCAVCLGHPGTLPVPNERAVEYATKIAMALGCSIAPRSIFHRKNYFYPDMPKNYQISQYDVPIGSTGDLGGVRITRVHLEEDTGKSIHVGGGGRIHEAKHSLEDFNRAGTPLVEIVTEPDITSPEQARTFASELRQILEYLDVSDVRMEEGSMRIDANISVSDVKVEVKNMNSLRSLYRALEYEEKRQRAAVENGETLEQSTRHWDEKAGVTSPLRTKEYAFDYRYFPEPDLVPMEPSVEWLRQVSEEVPELPSERRKRFIETFGLSEEVAGLLSSSPAVSEYFEAAVSNGNAVSIGNWVANDLAGLLAARGEAISAAKASPSALAGLVAMVEEGKLSKGQAKQVLEAMLESGRAPDEIATELGLAQVSDRGEIESVVDQVIGANPEIVERVRAGEDKPIGFLVGEVMKAKKGANPKLVSEILRSRLR